MHDYLHNSLTAEKASHAAVCSFLRQYFAELGFGGRIGFGGLLTRTAGSDFGHSTTALFPDVIFAGQEYPPRKKFPDPPLGIHSISAVFQQCGISTHYCSATIGNDDDTASISWRWKRLGILPEQPDIPLATTRFSNENGREHAKSDAVLNAASVPANTVPEEFSKEHLRISFSASHLAEISDIDAIFWGEWNTYPIEIKEKTPAPSSDLGLFFGLDVGPFVKLAFYAAKRGNLHSLYVVREIDNPQDRNLVQWWFITFDQLAQYASWIPQAGGPAMGGGQSSVVRVPRAEFQPLNANTLGAL